MASGATCVGQGRPELNALCTEALGILIPYEFGGFDGFSEQGIPDGCGRPGERDPRGADWTTDPLAPFVNLCGVGVCHRPEPLEPRAELLQFAALTDAVDEGLTVDGSDGF